MFQTEFKQLERTVRTLANSHWRKLAIMRSVANNPKLDEEIDRLYRAVSPSRLEGLSKDEAEGWLNALVTLEGQLAKVEQAIPFERKLRPLMRPFRRRFQNIIRLRNATACGISVLRRRAGQRSAALREPVRLASTDLLHAEDLIADRVPGWSADGMDLYDYV